MRHCYSSLLLYSQQKLQILAGWDQNTSQIQMQPNTFYNLTLEMRGSMHAALYLRVKLRIYLPFQEIINWKYSSS